jgi:Phospholipase B
MALVHRCWIGVAVGLVVALTASARAAAPVSSSQEFVPDPASVERYGPAYRYPQAGWIVLHIEGEPYERGYQHGRLLAPEIAAFIKAEASRRDPKSAGEVWRQMRTLVNALFLRSYEKEFLEEMKGIADGASAAGARFEGRPIDLVDIVAANSEMELACLDGALDATATGLEGELFREPPQGQPATPAPPEHCSAFAAVGPATADGKVVIGHITMFSLYLVTHYNVWIDIKPSHGHRVMMQTYPGGIQSGMDYYMNDAGMVVCETTIHQTAFDIAGRALTSRIRQALQYADSIDEAVRILRTGNNGLYTNEWLLADTKANEVAMFELGTHQSKLWRSSKNEWLGGAEGFYWGCNNAKDLQVRLETLASANGKPANMVFHPSDRDQKWLALYKANKGKITADFGFKAFTTPPLAAFSACDAKLTTTDMIKDLKTFALYGPPLGRTWDPSPEELVRLPDIRPLVANDWTVLRTTAPPSPSSGQAAAVDLAQNRPRTPASGRGGTGEQAEVRPDLSMSSQSIRPPVWRGTILPKTDAETWLAAAFADFEPIVALEKSLKARARDGKLSQDDRDRLDLALFGPRTRYFTAVQRRGSDLPLSETKVDWSKDDWYEVAAGKGVLLLAALREQMGPATFESMMDEFGRAQAGKPVSITDFWAAAVHACGNPLNTFFDLWLNGTGIPKDEAQNLWSIDSFEAEPERALIVYGTEKEAHAQREAADRLQRAIQRRWSNVTVPIKADSEVTDDDLIGHHILLVGRPDSNSVAARVAKALPVSFGPASFVVRKKTYAHPGSAVIAAGSNPINARFSVVIFAGLSADATWRCVQSASGRSSAAAEVLLAPEGSRPQRLVVPSGDKSSPVALKEDE